MYSLGETATLIELRRETSRRVRPVIHGGEKLTLTEHGQPCAEIILVKKIGRGAAGKALVAIGPGEAKRVGTQPLGRRLSRGQTALVNPGLYNRTLGN